MPVRTTSGQQILQFGGVFDLRSWPRGLLKSVVVLAFDEMETIAQFGFGIHIAFDCLALAVEANVPGGVMR